MPYRKVRATGTIRNTGGSSATYTATLIATMTHGTIDREVQAAESALTELSPRAVSNLITLEIPFIEMDEGDTISAYVRLDIVLPRNAVTTGVASSGTVTYTEPASYGGSVDFSSGISRRVGVSNIGEFEVRIEESNGSIPSWVGPVLGGAVVLYLLVAREKKLRSRKNPGEAWHRDYRYLNEDKAAGDPFPFTRKERVAKAEEHRFSENESRRMGIPNPGYGGYEFPAVEVYSKKLKDWVQVKKFTSNREAQREIQKFITRGVPARLSVGYEYNPRRR